MFLLEAFKPRKDRNNKPHSWCDDCRLKNIRAVTASRKEKIKIITEYKAEKGCVVCGFNVGVALDFHHIDPTVKDIGVADMFVYHRPLEEIFKEIEKCVVICANHHRMFHAGLVLIPV